ncbi:MAG: GntR family transcriptional regulator, partial [Ilumatobacteraceae bacterium]
MCLDFRMGARAITRTEQVYGSMRADILSGRLEPGARLPFAELTERYGASMGALR